MRGVWKQQRKLISWGGSELAQGVEKCEIKDNTAMKHSLFINQASMVVSANSTKKITNGLEDMLKTFVGNTSSKTFVQNLISGES